MKPYIAARIASGKTVDGTYLAYLANYLRNIKKVKPVHVGRSYHAAVRRLSVN